MTYQEALAYLEQASSFGIKPGLERITALMEALGNPQEDYKIVHVTGTNGKGSVTSYISYALFTSGLRVGRFTSPHLQSYTERIQINDGNITEEAFGELISRVKVAVDTIISNGIEAPTQFEILTLQPFVFKVSSCRLCSGRSWLRWTTRLHKYRDSKSICYYQCNNRSSSLLW